MSEVLKAVILFIVGVALYFVISFPVVLVSFAFVSQITAGYIAMGITGVVGILLFMWKKSLGAGMLVVTIINTISIFLTL